MTKRRNSRKREQGSGKRRQSSSTPSFTAYAERLDAKPKGGSRGRLLSVSSQKNRSRVSWNCQDPWAAKPIPRQGPEVEGWKGNWKPDLDRQSLADTVKPELLEIRDCRSLGWQLDASRDPCQIIANVLEGSPIHSVGMMVGYVNWSSNVSSCQYSFPSLTQRGIPWRPVRLRFELVV